MKKTRLLPYALLRLRIKQQCLGHIDHQLHRVARQSGVMRTYPAGDLAPVQIDKNQCVRTGGLKDLLQQTSGARITAHPHIFQPKYARRNGTMRYIGIPFSQEALEGWGGELRFSEDAVEIARQEKDTEVVDP